MKLFINVNKIWHTTDAPGTYTYITINGSVVAQWIERSPREREVEGSIPDRVIQNTL